MKEKRKGPISRAAGLAENVAAAVRRLQREREPRVLVYDPTGYARLVQPASRGHARHGDRRGDGEPRGIGPAPGESKPSDEDSG